MVGVVSLLKAKQLAHREEYRCLVDTIELGGVRENFIQQTRLVGEGGLVERTCDFNFYNTNPRQDVIPLHHVSRWENDTG